MEFVGMQKPEGVDHYNMLPLIVILLSKNLNQNLPFVHDAVMGYSFILVFDIPVCLLDPPMRCPVPGVDTREDIVVRDRDSDFPSQSASAQL